MPQTENELLQEKKRDIKRIIGSIRALPNEEGINHVLSLILYLNQLIRTRPLIAPTAEIMILLYTEKPLLYHRTRLTLSTGSHLHLLFEITGDPDLALKRLDEYLIKLDSDMIGVQEE